VISSAALEVRRQSYVTKKNFIPERNKEANKRYKSKVCRNEDVGMESYLVDIGGALDLFFAPSGPSLPTFRHFLAGGALGTTSEGEALLEQRLVFVAAISVLQHMSVRIS
jgi:hypothetical protein